MEDLLPILIGIVWFAYKMYQGAQKKAANQKKAPMVVSQEKEEKEYQNPEPKLEDLMESFFGVQKPKVVHADENNAYSSVENKYSDIEMYEADEAESIETGYQVNNTIPIIESIENETFSMRNRTISHLGNNMDEEDKSEIEENKFEFDIRKAVLYNAILNRPYV